MEENKRQWVIAAQKKLNIDWKKQNETYVFIKSSTSHIIQNKK